MKKLILMGIIVAIYTLLIFTGCPDMGGLLNPTPRPTVGPTPTLGPPMILIEGFVYQDSEWTYADITLYDSNNELPINDATVTVNGADCEPYSGGHYLGDVSALSAGSSVSFVITGTGFSVNETLNMPNATSSITSPTEGSNKNADASLNVNWNKINSNTPQHLIVYVEGFWTDNGDDYKVEVATSTTSHTIPANTLLPAQDDIELKVISINSVFPSGAIIDPDSYLDVYNVVMRKFNTN